MSDRFITAPPGLSAVFPDGLRLPVVAFQIEDDVLTPCYLREDGSVGMANGNCEMDADWIERS